MIFLEKLKEKSPCSVEETDILFSAGAFFHVANPVDFDGWIQINKDLATSEKEGTLAHEIGHARCCERSCKCYTKYDPILVEVHAELFALHYLLKHRNKEAIKARFRRLQDNWNCEGHREAIVIIKKRRIYKRCQEFVENYDLLS